MASIGVEQVEDRVCIRVGSTDIPVPYAESFNIANGIRVAAKQAARMAGETLPPDELIRFTDPNPFKEKRMRLPGKFEWSVKLKDFDENVYIFFGNVELVLHFTKAQEFANYMRACGRKAKLWSGDTSRHVNAVGLMTDAETAYKYGWN